ACRQVVNGGIVHDVMLDLFFFFQAEDGIRDLTVTGVQTCALPIWRTRRASGFSLTGTQFLTEAIKLYPDARRVLLTAYADTDTRSEERRVGKECRSRWSPAQLNEEKQVVSAACGRMNSHAPTIL